MKDLIFISISVFFNDGIFDLSKVDETTWMTSKFSKMLISETQYKLIKDACVVGNAKVVSLEFYTLGKLKIVYEAANGYTKPEIIAYCEDCTLVNFFKQPLNIIQGKDILNYECNKA